MTSDDDRATPPPAPTTRRGLGGWLDRTREYGWLRFLLTAAIVALLLRIPMVWIAVPLFGDDARTAYDWLADYDVAQLLLIAIVLGPMAETVVAQWLPIGLAHRFFGGDSYPVLLSAWLFGWLHFTQGMLLVLIMFTTGLVLAWTFVVWRARGLWQALGMTTAVHALLNAVALGAALLAPQAAGG